MNPLKHKTVSSYDADKMDRQSMGILWKLTEFNKPLCYYISNKCNLLKRKITENSIVQFKVSTFGKKKTKLLHYRQRE